MKDKTQAVTTSAAAPPMFAALVSRLSWDWRFARYLLIKYARGPGVECQIVWGLAVEEINSNLVCRHHNVLLTVRPHLSFGVTGAYIPCQTKVWFQREGINFLLIRNYTVAIRSILTPAAFTLKQLWFSLSHQKFCCDDPLLVGNGSGNCR
jgi:hypothetical protein